MHLITRKQKAVEAPTNWKARYLEQTHLYWDKHPFADGRYAKDIQAELEALGPIPTPDQITKVIGNDSWVNVWCDECEAEVEVAVLLGQEPNYESATAIVCLSCLEKALALAKGES